MSSILAAGFMLMCAAPGFAEQSADAAAKADTSAAERNKPPVPPAPPPKEATPDVPQARPAETSAVPSTFIDDPAGEQDKTPPPPDSLVNSLAKRITLGGQIRTRAEYRDPTSYANTLAATRTDRLFLTRIRLNLKFSLTDDIDVFVQPQDERQWGQEPSVLYDDKNFDLHQGFVEVRNLLGEPLSFKAGRMELSYGDQRLVSPLDWSNITRAWDGAKIRYAPQNFWIEGFYTVIRDPLSPTPAGAIPPLTNAPLAATGAAHDQDFMGVYFSYVGVANHEFDAYGFFREFRDNSAGTEALPAPPNPPSGNLVDRTIGARIKGKDLGFDYTAEAMSQGGHQATDRIEAYAYAGTLGYTFDMAWTPRLGVEYDFASGDRKAGDGKKGTFDPLFPFGHYYQGFADVFAFKNGKDLMGSIKVAPTETLSVQLDFHQFWLASETDAWYNASGTAIRPRRATSVGSRVGCETDLHARLAVGKYVKFWAGWSHFFAGEYVRQTEAPGPGGTSVDMNWFFLQMTVDF
jgi:hypothetical protein